MAFAMPSRYVCSSAKRHSKSSVRSQVARPSRSGESRHRSPPALSAATRAPRTRKSRTREEQARIPEVSQPRPRAAPLTRRARDLLSLDPMPVRPRRAPARSSPLPTVVIRLAHRPASALARGPRPPAKTSPRRSRSLCCVTSSRSCDASNRGVALNPPIGA